MYPLSATRVVCWSACAQVRETIGCHCCWGALQAQNVEIFKTINRRWMAKCLKTWKFVLYDLLAIQNPIHSLASWTTSSSCRFNLDLLEIADFEFLLAVQPLTKLRSIRALRFSVKSWSFHFPLSGAEQLKLTSCSFSSKKNSCSGSQLYGSFDLGSSKIEQLTATCD